MCPGEGRSAITQAPTDQNETGKTPETTNRRLKWDLWNGSAREVSEYLSSCAEKHKTASNSDADRENVYELLLGRIRDTLTQLRDQPEQQEKGPQQSEQQEIGQQEKKSQGMDQGNMERQEIEHQQIEQQQMGPRQTEQQKIEHPNEGQNGNNIGANIYATLLGRIQDTLQQQLHEQQEAQEMEQPPPDVEPLPSPTLIGAGPYPPSPPTSSPTIVAEVSNTLGWKLG